MASTLPFFSGSIPLREKAFRKTLTVSAIIAVVLLGMIFLTLLVDSLPSIRALGLGFIYGKTWDPVARKFGGLPFLAGTLITSLLALLFSAPFSIAVSLFLGEYYRKGPIAGIFKQLIDLLAGIPSVIYGFWGLFVLVPIVRGIEMKFNIPPYGVGIFTSSVILAIMVMPFSVSLSRQVISMVPGHLKEAAYSLGATRYEVIRYVVLPFTRSGLFAGILLALGRALGETMAVTMLIGNTHSLPSGLFSPGNTMASVIANEFTEATGQVYASVLIEMGLFLFLVATIINMIGKQIIRRFTLD
ncbi:MAG TPA: phosphate ABC transporter permease subunit PstC [Chitinophagaceae bacterium]|nr:phosphate ABC transporter permease subunit PstC [Chitinophagaceae bacterium]